MFRIAAFAGFLALAAASNGAATFDRITLSRTACHGTCPIYTVSVTADGAIHYGGERFVAQVGARSATLDAEGLKRLEAALATSDFALLRDDASFNDGCEMRATDNPSIVLSVVRGGAEKNIHYYLGCRGAAIDADLRRANEFGRAIDEILDTARWVGETDAALQ